MWIWSALFSFAFALELRSAEIEQARSLALNKNRRDACAVLKRALMNPTSAPVRTNLKEALAQLSRVPFTDKGQRAFESGQSILFEDPDAAIALFRQALALEDGNVAIRLALARALVIKNDLAGARAELKAARELNPFDAEVLLMDARTLTAERNFELARERVRAAPAAGRWPDSFASYLQAQDLAQQGLTQRAVDALNRVASDFPKFPEAQYVLAKVDRPRAAAMHLRRYVGLCRALSARDRRTFGLEPKLCANQKEAEDELAKSTVDL